ncbi:MAG: RNA 2',3'-cyclic phosphodiesterase [Planctomycetes bacterium]|nr:RNA 2',3'-cyclic phosphodiesterase [Planctomycetota bacterium]
MPQPIRAFIAVKVPPSDALRAVLRKLAGLGNAIKAVEPENLHVTLKFLGDTDPGLTSTICDIMRSAVRGQPQLRMPVSGMGAFPHVARPSVIWAGLEQAMPLVHVAATLDSELVGLNFEPEKRPLQPHVTLARVKRRPPPQLKALLAQHQNADFGEVTVTAIELFQSELRREGPRYTVLASVPLETS